MTPPSSPPPIDYDALDPGVRGLVRWLNDKGFETTDSGDGISKLAQGYDSSEMLDVPHVMIHCKGSEMCAKADRLMRELSRAGLCVEPVGTSGIFIQASYDPADSSATIQLIGVTDRAMGLS